MAMLMMMVFSYEYIEYDVIIAIPNSNAKLLRQKRVPEKTLVLKKRFIATEIPNKDNFDYSFNDYGKEVTKMRKPLIKLQNLINTCNAVKKWDRIQTAGLRNKYYNGLPTRDITKPNSEAFDFSKEYSFDEDYSDKYKAIEADDRIVGGIEVDISHFPYHVEYGYDCGGAIIDKKWILTAGHCGKAPYISVGSNHRDKGKLYVIKNYYVHPKWATRNKLHVFDYDVQLLELARPLKFSKSVQQVKLGRRSDLVIGKVVTVTGRGNIEEDGPISMTLQAVQVPIIPKNVCQRVRFPQFRGQLTPRMFCAGYKEGEKDACQGDSGGPAVANKRLLGIVSFGYGCAIPGSYGVYSNVPAVRSWIENTTGLTFE